MGLRQELMDFTTTYKALAPTSQDQYYEEKTREAKRKRKEAEEMDAIDKAAVDERRRQVEGGGTFDRSGRVTAIPSPFSVVPPKVRTASVEPAAPITSTFATAFDTGWPQARQGGMIRRPMKRYAAGGDVTNPGRDEDEVAQNDADLIVQQFLGPKGADTNDALLSTGNARIPPTPDAADDTGLAKRPTAADTARVNQRLMEINIPRTEDQPLGPDDVTAIKTRTPPPPTVSPYRSWIQGEGGVDEDAANARAKLEEHNLRMRERRAGKQAAGAAVAEERQKVFTPQTPQERQASTERIAQAEAVRNDTRPADIVYPVTEESLRRDEAAAVPPAPPAAPSNAPDLPANAQVDIDGYPIAPVRQPDGTYVPGANKEGVSNLPPQGSQDPPRTAPPALRPSSDPRVATGDPDPAMALRPTSPYPAVALPSASTGVPDKRSTQYGPGTEAPTPAVTPAATTPAATTAPAKPSATAGASGPSGSSVAPAPPPGAASANAPSSARKEDPRTRTAAFEPGRERVDPTTGATQARDLDAAGKVVYPSPQDMQQVVAGATTAAPRQGGEIVGNGAVSRDNMRAFVDAHNPGGRFTKGQALMVGMTSRYKQLLAKGRVKEAAAMAWGLIQAANLEAASFGEVAKDQLRRGDITGATQSLVQGLDYTPDGMGHRAVPGGIETYDPRTGQVTARTKIDGKTALAIALGMSDGSMLWEALQKASAQVAPPDKDAQGRALREELTRLRIAREQQRLAAGPGGGGGRGGRGGKAPVAKTAEEQELDKIYGAPPG